MDPKTPQFGSHIPIIGEPVIDDISIIVAFKLTCPCGEIMAFVGGLGTIRPCNNPKCKKLFKVNGLPVASADGTVNIPFAHTSRP